MRWVILWKHLLVFLLPARIMQSSLYYLYTSYQVTRSVRLMTIHHSFPPSPALPLLAISGITYAQPAMFPTLNTCNSIAASAYLTWTNFETGSKLLEFSCIVVSARANQYTTKAPSLFRSLMLNSRCSCHGRWPFSAPQHLPRHCITHAQSFHRSPVDWSDGLDPRSYSGCPTSEWSSGRRFGPTFVTYVRGGLPTTPEKPNTCSCAGATSAAIVKSCESWLDQETLYHERGPRPSHLWHPKHWMSVSLHRCVPRWILVYGPDPTTGIDLLPMFPSLPQQLPSPFLGGCPLVPMLWVENESTSEAIARCYSRTQRKETQRERMRLCRLEMCLELEALFVQVMSCWESSGCRRCVEYGRQRDRRCRWEEGIYIYSSFSYFLGQLVRYDNIDSYPAFRWLTNTTWPTLHLAQPPGTSWLRCLEKKFSTQSVEHVWCRALLLHRTPRLPLRPCASWNKLSSSEVVPTVQPSNTATNTHSCGKSTWHWCHRIENTWLFALQWL